MAQEKDTQFVQQLIEATKQGRVSWEPTARIDEFTTSFRGRFAVTVSRPSPGVYVLRMADEADREMLKVERLELDEQGRELAYWQLGNLPPINELFELARRAGLHVDEALNEILTELKGQ